ncbi:MAG: ExbD/TolR family protein [Planctomycetota bacterium]|jgi:biopolymer transport protein ExbD
MKLEGTISRKRARVEMIPLIDCVFILLVFFIYSMLAMTIQRGLVVQLPTAGAVETNRDDAVVVTITGEGELLLNKQPVTLDSLPAAIEGVRESDRSARFVVNADARAEHGRVVAVLDRLKGLGVTQVMILAEESVSP